MSIKYAWRVFSVGAVGVLILNASYGLSGAKRSFSDKAVMYES